MIRFDPYDYALHADPYPTYARMRENAPLYRDRDGEWWALSRHPDVTAALHDTRRYSSAYGVSLEPGASGSHARRNSSFLAMDAPEHSRLRALVGRGFAPRLVRGLEPRIREIARAHIRSTLDQDSVDLLTDVAAKLPMDVISELLHQVEGLEDVADVGPPDPGQGLLAEVVDATAAQ